MLKVIFYDRKNNREVSNEQLMFINLVEYVAVGDKDDEFVPTGRRISPVTSESLSLDSFNEVQQALDPNFIGEDWNMWKEEKTPKVLHLKEKLVSNLGYKSENCPNYQNWDLYTTIDSLVFLRFEDKNGRKS